MRTLFALVLLSIAAAPAPADGDARAHYRAGTAAYALGRYGDAADEYEKAFALHPDAALLYNAAQAHRMANNKPRALLLYQNYLRLYGEGASNRVEVLRFIVQLKAAIEADKTSVSQPPIGTDSLKLELLPTSTDSARSSRNARRKSAGRSSRGCGARSAAPRRWCSTSVWASASASASPAPGIPTPASGRCATFLGGATGTHYCAIVAGGELRCWGYNDSGQLGSGAASAGMQNTPQVVCAPDSKTLPCAHATGATWVRGSDNSTCAVFGGGAVACWGANGSGQLGPEAPQPPPSPFHQTVPGVVADSVTGGNATTCAVSGGRALCWGGGGDVMGSSAAGNLPQPTAVCTSSDCAMTLMGVTSVDTFDESACATATGGMVRCWGANDTDQLGDGTPHTSKTTQGYAATITLSSGAVSVVSAGQASFASSPTGPTAICCAGARTPTASWATTSPRATPPRRRSSPSGSDVDTHSLTR